MSRPFKHPKTGIYWLRKRVPADIQPLTRKFVQALSDLETSWSICDADQRP